MRNTASLSEVIQPDADPLTPSAQLVALPTATTAAVVPGVASNLLAAFSMTTTSDNDAAPTPNHSLIASLLPTIRPPAALLEPDGHTKRTTAQAVIGKVMSLCMMAGIIGSIYAFGELTVGTDCLNKLSFAPGKLEQWSYGIGYYDTATQAAITSAYDGDKANLALAAGEVPNLVDCAGAGSGPRAWPGPVWMRARARKEEGLINPETRNPPASCGGCF